MRVVLTVYRFHCPHEIECTSIKEAVGMARGVLDSDSAYPEKIVAYPMYIGQQEQIIEGDELWERIDGRL